MKTSLLPIIFCTECLKVLVSMGFLDMRVDTKFYVKLNYQNCIKETSVPK